MQNTQRPTGMFGFTIVWLGQIVSVLATNMSAFALTIWVFQKTGSATALGLVQVFFITPLLIITPFAGVMVDRHIVDRFNPCLFGADNVVQEAGWFQPLGE